ncbi:MAG: response regulator [SAR202 cluster bacterium]|nr:response regulator [SAR202 cluster bacterium]
MLNQYKNSNSGGRHRRRLADSKEGLRSHNGMSKEVETDRLAANITEGNSSGSLNLLIVDDHRTTGLTLKAVLEREGFHVWYASDISAANNLIERKDFSITIVDMDLDRHSGLEVMRTLKTQQPRCRAIVLTGFPSVGAKEVAFREGAIGFLVKPCDLTDLIKTIEKALKSSRSKS